MTANERRDEWRQGEDHATKLDVYVELCVDMDEAARAGIQDIIGAQAHSHDVEEVMMHGFNEFWDMDRSRLRSEVGMARRICRMRGRDRGRSILNERKKTSALGAEQIDEADPVSEIDEANRSKVSAALRECVEKLTVNQRLVIEGTASGVWGEEVPVLTEWVKQSGTTKSYEAWRRTRVRGVSSLKKCIEIAVPEAASVW